MSWLSKTPPGTSLFGSLQVYSGPRPATPDDPLKPENVLLVQLDCPATGFRAERGNACFVLRMDTLRGIVRNEGRATFARLCDPTGRAARDFSVGAPSHPSSAQRAEVVFAQLYMETGALVTIHDFTLSMPAERTDFVDCDWTEQDVPELASGEPRRLTRGEP